METSWDMRAFLSSFQKTGVEYPILLRGKNGTRPKQPQEIVVKTKKVYHNVEKSHNRIVMTGPLELL
jgi:hypothetical protein